ncbi:MAG: hypothetical protein HS129_00525 [Leptospiraceae bacterium]|nr:hypothetical protein [Leptospiraceae bacterium]
MENQLTPKKDQDQQLFSLIQAASELFKTFGHENFESEKLRYKHEKEMEKMRIESTGKFNKSILILTSFIFTVLFSFAIILVFKSQIPESMEIVKLIGSLFAGGLAGFGIGVYSGKKANPKENL